MRTITQRTTDPFFTCDSGAASFTLAVTTSPRPARNPISPPRGKMQASLRAPLLPIAVVSVMISCPLLLLASLGRLYRSLHGSHRSIPALLLKGHNPCALLAQQAVFLDSIALAHGHLESQPEHAFRAGLQLIGELAWIRRPNFIHYLFHNTLALVQPVARD